jgi:hypothetical protein
VVLQGSIVWIQQFQNVARFLVIVWLILKTGWETDGVIMEITTQKLVNGILGTAVRQPVDKGVGSSLHHAVWLGFIV